MIKGFLNLPWFVWAALALLVAIVYSFIWPRKVAASTDFGFFIICWGHALTWFLIASNFVLRGISLSWNGIANIIALAGGIMYILFLTMTFVTK